MYGSLAAGSAAVLRGAMWILLWGLVICVVSLFMHPCSKPGVGARRVHCLNNLKQIGIASRMYSADHARAFPGLFGEMEPYVGSNAVTLFVCASARRGERPLPRVVAEIDGCTDYRLVTGLTETSTPNAVLAFCPPENHRGDGANVLFVDGHVEWLDRDDFVAMTNDPVGFATNSVWR
jgi:prepilin-type processing-associated H-X9-DG protein